MRRATFVYLPVVADKHTGDIKHYGIFDGRDTKVIMVARRDNPNQFGMPGGKVEQGESYIDAAIRETFEETGIKIAHGCLDFLYAGPCASGHWGVTLLARERYPWKDGKDNKGIIPPEKLEGDAGRVVAACPEVLFKKPLGRYNIEVQAALERYRHLCT